MTDPEHLLADYEDRMAATTRMAEQVRTGLDAVNTTARSSDGKVVVTVNASGNVVDLRLPDTDLAATVLNTIRRAQSQLADAVRTAMPAELRGTAVLAELDSQYRTAYPEPARKPRPARGDDEPEFGDRTLLR